MPQGLFAKLVKEKPKEPAEVLAKACAALTALQHASGGGAAPGGGSGAGSVGAAAPPPPAAGSAAAIAREKDAAAVHKYLGYLKFFLFGDEHGGAGGASSGSGAGAGGGSATGSGAGGGSERGGGSSGSALLGGSERGGARGGAHAGAGGDPTKESVLALVRQIVATEFTQLLVGALPLLEFEARKDAAQVFGAIVRIRDDVCDPPAPGAAYVLAHPHILLTLFEGYDSPAIALNCGAMYRDCIRDEAIARAELYSSHFMEFFSRVEVANFEIASDAFSSFKDLLTRHKAVVASFLSDRYAPFFEGYETLLRSSNYVTRRQSLKLLSELLLAPNNLRLMLRYVSDPGNLMQMMNLLKDSSRSIQFEAFHVFKVFVANPAKPRPIVDILTNNRSKLLKYLEDFHTDRDDDEQFKEEKAVIIREISLLGQQQQDAAAAAAQQQQAQDDPQQQHAAAQQQQQQAPELAAAPQQQQQQQAQAGARNSSDEGVS